MLTEGSLQQSFLAEQLKTDKTQRQSPIENGRFPLDERFIAQRQGGASEHGHGQQSPEVAFFPVAAHGPADHDLPGGGCNQHGRGTEDAVKGIRPEAQFNRFAIQLIDDKEQGDGQEFQELFHDVSGIGKIDMAGTSVTDCGGADGCECVASRGLTGGGRIRRQWQC